MKRISLCGLAMLAFIAIYASYPSMKFVTNDGAEYFIGTENLEITFSDGKMTATTGYNNLELALDKLSAMEFSESEASIDQIQFIKSSLFKVFTVDGSYCGTFDDIEQLKAVLTDGIYVIKNDEGNSLKISVKR